MSDLSKLRVLAENATPGKWGRAASRTIEAEQDGSWQIVIDQMNDGVGAGVVESADAEYIIAAQPSTVLALIARAEAAEVKVAAVEVLHRRSYAVFSWATGGVRYEEPCPDCGGKAGVHPCGCWADTDMEYVCSECKEGQKSVSWPCPTVRAIQESEGQ